MLPNTKFDLKKKKKVLPMEKFNYYDSILRKLQAFSKMGIKSKN